MHARAYAHTNAEILFSHEKNEILLFAAIWMDLGNIMFSEMSSIEGHILYDTTCMWNLKKKNTNECIHKMETDSQIRKTKFWLQTGKGRYKGQTSGMGLRDTTTKYKIDKQQSYTL